MTSLFHWCLFSLPPAVLLVDLDIITMNIIPQPPSMGDIPLESNLSLHFSAVLVKVIVLFSTLGFGQALKTCVKYRPGESTRGGAATKRTGMSTET